MRYSLLPWQEECLQKWRDNNFKGIAHVATGAGKTILAAAAVEMLQRLNIGGGRPLAVKIVVPKAFLLNQWRKVLTGQLDVPPQDIGFCSGTHKTARLRRFMIYVINSARYTLAKSIVDDIQNGKTVFVIADECHHYGSVENARIFDYRPFLSEDAPVFTIGLSATPYCRNYGEVLVPALGDEIYRFGFFHAIKANVINTFTLFNIRLRFSANEAAKYRDLSDQLGVCLHKLKEKCPMLRSMQSGDFFAMIEKLIGEADDEIAELAQAVFFLALQRKDIVHHAGSRIACVVDLVMLARKTARILIFCERIDTAESIYGRLTDLCPNEVGIYHSKVLGKNGKETLRQFNDAEIRILVSCRTLDEGLNINETDIGIVVSSTSSKRQRIQRLGRVLRKKQHGKAALFYYMYIGDATEESGLLKEMCDDHLNRLAQVVDLQYDHEYGEFSNAYFEKLADSVIAGLQIRGHGEKVAEFLRNARIGLMSGDWLLTEDECIRQLGPPSWGHKSASKAERNYYVAMLLLIRARRDGF